MEVLDRKEIKNIQTRKEEIKLFLCPDDITAYVENPKESTKKANRFNVSLAKFRIQNQHTKTNCISICL